jgi:hypothetical protein
MALADQAGLERIFQRWELHPAPEQGQEYANPTLILVGRQTVLDRAGHALPHEQQGLLAALVGEWLDRCRPD